MEELFDECDVFKTGKVAVSSLIHHARRRFSQENEQEVLEDIKFSLNPTDDELEIDKATWIRAWSSPPGLNCSGTDYGVISEHDTSCSRLNYSPGSSNVLDQSRRSYCFSPGSQSSNGGTSDEASLEEVAKLKHQLLTQLRDLKNLQDQLQLSEENLMQEQTLRTQCERELKERTNKFEERYSDLEAVVSEVKEELLTSENEKFQLCAELKNKTCELRELKIENEENTKEISRMNKELDEANNSEKLLHKEIENLKAESNEQKIQLRQCHELISSLEKKLQQEEVKIKDSMAENEEMNLHLSRLEWEKRNLKSHCEELMLQVPVCIPTPDVNKVKSEENNSSGVSDDSPCAKILKVMPPGLTSTPLLPFDWTPMGKSLLDEIEATGSFIKTGGSSDCESSFEEDGYRRETLQSMEIVKDSLPRYCQDSSYTQTEQLENEPKEDEASAHQTCKNSIAIQTSVNQTVSQDAQTSFPQCDGCPARLPSQSVATQTNDCSERDQSLILEEKLCTKTSAEIQTSLVESFSQGTQMDTPICCLPIPKVSCTIGTQTYVYERCDQSVMTDGKQCIKINAGNQTNRLESSSRKTQTDIPTAEAPLTIATQTNIFEKNDERATTDMELEIPKKSSATQTTGGASECYTQGTQTDFAGSAITPTIYFKEREEENCETEGKLDGGVVDSFSQTDEQRFDTNICNIFEAGDSKSVELSMKCRVPEEILEEPSSSSNTSSPLVPCRLTSTPKKLKLNYSFPSKDDELHTLVWEHHPQLRRRSSQPAPKITPLEETMVNCVHSTVSEGSADRSTRAPYKLSSFLKMPKLTPQHQATYFPFHGDKNYSKGTGTQKCSVWKWLVPVVLTATFVLILISLTIVCTAAVLELATEAGVLSFPLYGHSPSWIKSILRPFFRVRPVYAYHPV